VILAPVAALLAERWATTPLQWLLWSDRDLVRASRLALERPVVGPEVSYGDGARLPGGLLYELWGLVVAAGGGPEAVYRLQAALEVGALALIGVLVAQRTDAWAGAVAVAVALTALPWVSTTAAVWNPALVPLFAAAALVGADRAVTDGRADAVAAVALAGALGAQVHLTAGAVALVLLVAIALLRPRVAARGALPAIGAVLVVALPYLVVDASRGWPNTRAIGTAPRGAPGDGDLLAAAWWLRPDVDFAVGLGAHGAWLALGAALAVAALGLARRDRATVGALLPPVAVVGVTVVGLARSDTGAAALRYALAAVPAWAVLVGEGFGRLRRQVGQRSPVATLAVVVPVTVLAVAVVGAERQALADRAGEPARWATLNAALDDVRARTGWSLREAVGRTSLWERVGGAWSHEARRGVTWLLDRQEVDFPGSLPSPCALVLFGGRDEVVDDAWLAAELPASLGAPHVTADEPWGRDGRLVRYTLDGGLCPTSLAQRYLDTLAEAEVRDLWRRAPDGRAVPVPGRATRHVGRLRVDDVPPVAVAVDLLPGPGRLDAVLHANQLRGRAYNTELLEDGFVVRPRLRLERPGEVRELVLAPGLVGDGGALTPLRAGGRLPAGTWTVELVAEVPTARPRPATPPPPTRTARLHLVDALVVPEGP
jgi:hypothetical protein